MNRKIINDRSGAVSLKASGISFGSQAGPDRTDRILSGILRNPQGIYLMPAKMDVQGGIIDLGQHLELYITRKELIRQLDHLKGIFMVNVSWGGMKRAFALINDDEFNKNKLLNVMPDLLSDISWERLLYSKIRAQGTYVVVNDNRALLKDLFSSTSQIVIEGKNPFFLGIFHVGDNKQIDIKGSYLIDDL
jgi:hypothetical protein